MKLVFQDFSVKKKFFHYCTLIRFTYLLKCLSQSNSDDVRNFLYFQIFAKVKNWNNKCFFYFVGGGGIKIAIKCDQMFES